MAKFRPIKKHGTGLERWKDEKTGKERRRTGWLIPRKIGKRGKTRSRKEKKRKRTGTRKILFKRERVSFLSRSCKFWPAHISRCQAASLKEGVLGGLGPTVCAVIATLERQLLLTADSQPCQWNLWWHPCHGLHTFPSACPKGTTWMHVELG